MAAKIFEVGDVLPATTQLRISWNEDFDTIDYLRLAIETPFSHIFPLVYCDFNDDDVFVCQIHNYGDNIIVFNVGYRSPYTNPSGGHNYVDIDTSELSESYRTVSSINIDTYEISGGEIQTIFYWEDLNAPTGYSITFEENGGSTVTDLTEQIALPNPLPIPTKENHSFLGWYYDSDFTNEAFADDPLTGDVTLYAKWELNTYTITYNSNGGSIVPQTSNATQLPSPLPTTTKANHVFAGWYYDNLFTQKANAGDELTTNVTLYAKWYTPTTWCEDIADAIREKEGSSGNIKHVDFPDRIRELANNPDIDIILDEISEV